jgi:hypothetical protein
VLNDRLRRRVILTMVSGESWSGTLAEVDARAWVLRDVTALGVGDAGSNVQADGELLVLVEQIAHCQLP